MDEEDRTFRSTNGSVLLLSPPLITAVSTVPKGCLSRPDCSHSPITSIATLSRQSSSEALSKPFITTTAPINSVISGGDQQKNSPLFHHVTERLRSPPTCSPSFSPSPPPFSPSQLPYSSDNHDAIALQHKRMKHSPSNLSSTSSNQSVSVPRKSHPSMSSSAMHPGSYGAPLVSSGCHGTEEFHSHQIFPHTSGAWNRTHGRAYSGCSQQGSHCRAMTLHHRRNLTADCQVGPVK